MNNFCVCYFSCGYNFCICIIFVWVYFFVRVIFCVFIFSCVCIFACVKFLCVNFFACVHFFRVCLIFCACIIFRACVFSRVSIYSFCTHVTSASKGSRMPSVLAITSQSKSLISSLPSVYQEENLLFFLALNFFQLDVTVLQNIDHHCTHWAILTLIHTTL